jgi:hypothetical protein
MRIRRYPSDYESSGALSKALPIDGVFSRTVIGPQFTVDENLPDSEQPYRMTNDLTLCFGGRARKSPSIRANSP